MVETKNFDCWTQKSKVEKILTACVVVLSIVIFALIIHLIVRADKSNNPCLTKECVKASALILTYLDPTLDPCDNFHDFVCGTYLKNAVEKHQKSIANALTEQTKYEIDAIIVKNDKNAPTKSLKLEREFYQSCMNTTAIEEDENDTFLSLLTSLGGWPIIERNRWKESEFDWESTMIKARKLGVSFERFIEVGVDEDEPILKITHPYELKIISLDRFEPYVEMMTEIAVLLRAPSIGANGELRRMTHFHNELARIAQKSENKMNAPNYTTPRIMISELENRYPRIPWLNLLNGLMDNVVTVKRNDIIAFDIEDYLKDLELLFLKSPKSTVANYIIWKIIEKSIGFLTKNIRDRYDKYLARFPESVLKPHNENRKEFCLRVTKQEFPHVAEAEYVRRHVSSEKIRTIQTLFHEVKKEFLKRLITSSHLQKQHIYDNYLEIVSNMTLYIGGPDIIYDVEKFEKYAGFEDLEFTSSSIIHVITAVGLNSFNNYYDQINEKVDSVGEFLMKRSTSVNAYYMGEKNLLILPAPILQETFYDKNRPNYLNYGALGSSLSHEFTHGLALIGKSRYENKGKYYVQVNEVFHKALEKSGNCIVQEYDDYMRSNKEKSEPASATDLPNGNDTLEENIADYVGVDVAYAIYQKFTKHHGVESRLPSLNYTPNQLFWIASSTIFCQKPSEKERTDQLHAGGAYRVNYRLKNSEHFARDFNCPSGSYMNPSIKCKVF